MKSGRTFVSSTLIILVNLGLPLYLIWEGLSFPMEIDFILYNLGKFTGFSAFLIFTMQYLWTARFHSFERLVPYDRRVAIHRTLGFSGFMVSVMHPVLILLSYNLIGMTLFISSEILIGLLALIILLLIVGSTFLGRLWRVCFETWKKVHYVTFVVLTLAFIHSLRAGSDLYGINRVIWIIMWSSHVLVMVGKIITKIITWNRKFTVKEIVNEAPGSTTLFMDKPHRSWTAGQFGFLSLKIKNKWEGWHPFSITSLPEDDHLSMTIKSLGDFSGAIKDTKIGDPVKLNPGFGGFTIDRHIDDKYIMIAGGVGLTPIYNIIKSLNKGENPPALKLLYTVHHESEILFRSELEEWFGNRSNWDLEYIVTSQPDWEGTRGRLTPEKVLNLCNENLSGTFFLCGPALMTRSIEKFLRKNGVPKRRIVMEYFVFLP